jgi:hypothetical protein
MTRSNTQAAAPETDTRNIKPSRQDDLAARGVKLSHGTVRKIIAGRRIAA